MIYIIIAGYFEDNASDKLTNDLMFKAVLEKSFGITANCFKIFQSYGRRHVKSVSYYRKNTKKENLQYPAA